MPGENEFQFLWLAGVNDGGQPDSASRCNAKLPTLVSSEGPSTSRNRGVFFWSVAASYERMNATQADFCAQADPPAQRYSYQRVRLE